MFIYRNIDGDDSDVFPTGSSDGQLEHYKDDDPSGATIQDVRKAVVSTGAPDDDSGEGARTSYPSIPCIIDPDGLKTVPPPIAADGRLIKPEQLNLFIELDERSDTSVDPDSFVNGDSEPGETKSTEQFESANGVVSDDGVINVRGAIISGITPERDAFSNIRFVGDSTPLTEEQIEERQIRMRIETRIQ